MEALRDRDAETVTVSQSHKTALCLSSRHNGTEKNTEDETDDQRDFGDKVQRETEGSRDGF
jgi:hypothetical protein